MIQVGAKVGRTIADVVVYRVTGGDNQQIVVTAVSSTLPNQSDRPTPRVLKAREQADCGRSLVDDIYSDNLTNYLSEFLNRFSEPERGLVCLLAGRDMMRSDQGIGRHAVRHHSDR